MERRFFIFLAIIVVLFGALFFRGRSKKQERAQDVVGSKVTAESSSPKPVSSSPVNTTIPTEINMNSKTGVSVAPTVGSSYVKDDSGRRFLTINLVPLNQCQKGDADAMLSLDRDFGAPIIATLEPIDEKDAAKAVVRELSEKDFAAGTNFGLQVKEDSPKVFAIYICSDGARSNSCRKKPPARLLLGYQGFRSSLQATSDKDFVFFAHLLILDKQNYQVYQSNFDLENIGNTIAAALNKPSLSPQEFDTARRMSKLLNSIRPYPIAPINDGGVGTVLRISITRQDTKLCR